MWQRAITLGGMAWLLIAATVALAACSDRQGLLPPSGGKPYEVLVVGDRDGMVATALRSEADGLPQREPEFDVSTTDSDGFKAPLKVARNIVMVSINPEIYTATRIRYEKNVFASPQLMVYISAPSPETLRKDLARLTPRLLDLLRRAELNAAIARLRQQRNAKAENMVKRMFGVDLWIPMDMLSSKRGKDFLWLSNNAPDGMRNIVVYRSRKAASPQQFITLRDSVMCANIKGETDAMYMQTVAETVTESVAREKGRTIIIRRGLWQMKGDAMGGPFVSHTAGNLTVEAFVFAPGTKKRNQMRQLEAALYTLK